MLTSQTTAEFVGELLVALLAHRLQVALVKLGLLVHFLVTDGTGKVVNAPRLVQGGKHIARDDLIANEAKIPKQLMIMRFAVGQAFLFVMAVTKERFLAFGTSEMLHMPVFTESGNHSFFDGTTASPADRYPHLVVATQAVQLIHVILGITRTVPNLPSVTVKFDAASSTIEVVRVVHLPAELQRLVIDHCMALITHVFP